MRSSLRELLAVLISVVSARVQPPEGVQTPRKKAARRGERIKKTEGNPTVPV
jgi:hypothetical protein